MFEISVVAMAVFNLVGNFVLTLILIGVKRKQECYDNLEREVKAQAQTLIDGKFEELMRGQDIIVARLERGGVSAAHRFAVADLPRGDVEHAVDYYRRLCLRDPPRYRGRAPAAATASGDPELSVAPEEIEGWTVRNTIDEPRLSELVELYEELGFDVMLRPVSLDHTGEVCAECVMIDPERYKTIYTRPRNDD